MVDFMINLCMGNMETIGHVQYTEHTDWLRVFFKMVEICDVENAVKNGASIEKFTTVFPRAFCAVTNFPSVATVTSASSQSSLFYYP